MQRPFTATQIYGQAFVRPGLVLAVVAGALALAGCDHTSQQAVEVVVVGDPSSPFAPPSAAQPLAARMLRAAGAEGLVALDADGKVVPALADRWIVTDDGLSYIFRLRGGNWPDGVRLTGESAKVALSKAIAAQAGTPLGRDLAAIADIRNTAGRVLELRLDRPMPDLLQLMAQPELGLLHHSKGAGPFDVERIGPFAHLTLIARERLGLAEAEDGPTPTRPLNLRALPAAQALEAFDQGRAGLVLGATMVDWPRLATSKQRAGLRQDPVAGLFGLAVTNNQGLLAIARNREALAMAIDRDSLAARFALPGWVATTRIVTPGLDGDSGLVGERWTDMSLEVRRTLAAQRIAAWARYAKQTPQLRLALPDGPGADRLAQQLVADFATIGVRLERVDAKAPADLQLVDQVAWLPSPGWYFNQLHCQAARRPCSPEADALAEQASHADSAHAPGYYAQAERAQAQAGQYIPLGVPVRWGLVDATTTGYTANRWGYHALAPLLTRAK